MYPKRSLHINLDIDYRTWLEREANRKKITQTDLVMFLIDFYIRNKQIPEKLDLAKTMIRDIVRSEIKKEKIRINFADMMD